MLNNAIVGTDFSQASEAVVDWVPHLKTAGLEHVYLTHVAHVVNTPGLEEALMDEARPLLDEQAGKLHRAGLEVETVLRTGVPAVKLADLAEEKMASAIVVGSHGRSMLSRILLGSVSMSLLHQTTVPVLLVRMELCKTDEGISCKLQSTRPFSHILFPTDFSEAARSAFEQVKTLASETGAKVTLLHAQNLNALDHDLSDAEEANALDRQRLAGMEDELHRGGAAQVETVLETGSPASIITEHAAEQDISLIAMSTHGRGAYEDLAVGSVALKVARTSPVPVMMMPHR